MPDVGEFNNPDCTAVIYRLFRSIRHKNHEITYRSQH